MYAIFLHVLLATSAFAEDPVTPPVPAVVVVAPDAPVVAAAVPVTPPVITDTPVVTPADPATPAAVPAAVTPEVKVPTTTGEAAVDGQKAFDAVQAGEWGTAAVLLLGVLGFIYNKYVRKA